MLTTKFIKGKKESKALQIQAYNTYRLQLLTKSMLCLKTLSWRHVFDKRWSEVQATMLSFNNLHTHSCTYKWSHHIMNRPLISQVWNSARVLGGASCIICYYKYYMMITHITSRNWYKSRHVPGQQRATCATRSAYCSETYDSTLKFSFPGDTYFTPMTVDRPVERKFRKSQDCFLTEWTLKTVKKKIDEQVAMNWKQWGWTWLQYPSGKTRIVG